MTAVATVVGGVVLLCSVAFASISLREGERRAAAVTLAIGLGAAIPYVGVRFVGFPLREPLAMALVAVTAASVLALAAPWRSRQCGRDDTPRSRIDERDTMFSRNDLAEDSDRCRDYYLRRPENRGPDDEFRRSPGLLTQGTTYFDPWMCAAAKASFSSVRALRTLVDRAPSVNAPEPSDPAGISEFIKRWALKLGAVSAGITELRDYHLYSVVGRGSHYGEPATLDHTFAVVVSVEMGRDVLDYAPHAPTVMESAQQYLVSGAIAVQIAQFIRELGHSARAHIDGDYRVVAPLVARDAGLGEIGRMGLLMTPWFGPRVRIAAVTTDMPLVPDARRRDCSVLDFCSRCTKCAANCPAGAIPFGDRAEIEGVRRWRINQEACFTHWCKVGTDCARCVRVCPYSHPDSTPHNVVRAAIRNSRLFSMVALTMDDVLYGKRPGARVPPPWMIVNRAGGKKGR